MLIVFPMNGRGERFTTAGYTTLKPLLPVNGIPLITKAMRSVPQGNFMLFILRKENAQEIRPYLKGMFGVVIAEKDTPGPLQTVLLPEVEDFIKVEDSLLIADCDSFFTKPHELDEAIFEFLEKGADGGVTVRESESTAVSYAKIEDGWVLETREKDPFTKWSTTGPYWFRSGKQFWDAGQKAAANGAVSISPVYNEIYKEWGRIWSVPVKSFVHLGDPASYEAYSGNT